VDVDREAVHVHVAAIRDRIAAAATRAGREPAEITLVAATKTTDGDRIRWAREAGVDAFGENYAADLASKRAAAPDASWHFIGTLQSGTAATVADHADVVESLAGDRAARRLAGRAARAGRTLDVLIEVDLTPEGRAGVRPDDLPRFADLVGSLDGLRLIGLMTVPPIPAEAEESRPHFAHLRRLTEELRNTHPEVLESSMGMSLDYEVAVEEGATMIRIGTALFGPRATREEPR
jgi:PLP dependent protein